MQAMSSSIFSLTLKVKMLSLSYLSIKTSVESIEFFGSENVICLRLFYTNFLFKPIYVDVGG